MKIISRTASTSSATLRYVTVFHAMWIPGLLFEDTDGKEKPSQTPENMGYFRDYHKACGRKTGNQLGTLRWCHSPGRACSRLRALATGTVARSTVRKTKHGHKDGRHARHSCIILL